MTKPETYEIYALRYAEKNDRARQDNFLEPVDMHDAAMPMDFYVWLLRSDKRTIVVDTGFDHAEATKRGRTITCVPADVLSRFGVNAATIDDVIITHLHYDHAGTLGDFEQAKFHIQESEMQFATGKWMLDDNERYAYSADHVAELVHRVFDKRVAFHGEDGEVAPGITLHQMPGHTMGMQAVRVRTKRGWVLLASDASHYYEHWVKRMPFAICWSPADLMKSYERFEQLADSEDHIIPGHDPLVRSLYPRISSDLGSNVVRLDESPLKLLKDVFKA